MKKTTYSLIFIILLIFSSVFIWNKAQKDMNVKSTLVFKVLTNQSIDNDIQINIKTINEINDIKSSKNKIFTIFKDGIYYPIKSQSDFKMYEIFIKKNNKFAYMSGENIFFIEDESSIRGNSERRGEILIHPYEEDEYILLQYNQYYKNNKSENIKKIKLLESYEFDSRIFNEKIKLDDFNSVKLP